MLPDVLKRLTDTIGYLPGIGDKTAMKLALFLLKSHPAYVENFAKTLSRLHAEVVPCTICGNLMGPQNTICSICSDSERKEDVLCVVEEYPDLLAIERLGIFRGKYHVLGGAISPVHGISPDDLSIQNLIHRLEPTTVQELILATNANLEGEATAAYIKERLPRSDIRVTRLSKGLPNAGAIEYADEITLINAFTGRG